jgi:predicted nucleic acid-binding protein
MISVPIQCVVDASVAIKLAVHEPDSPLARALFAHLHADPLARFHVPDLFFAECANILWKRAKQGTLQPYVVQASLTAIDRLPLVVLGLKSLVLDAATIAIRHDITVYDACYVAAAVHCGAPLVTADAKLVAKLTLSGYSVSQLGSFPIPALPTPPSP